MIEKKNVVVEKSFRFAVRIVRLYQFLCAEKREYVLSKQLLRCGTSIGANIQEAIHAQSKKDFLNKINVALKEANETQYWINLMYATNFLDEKQKESIYTDCDEIISILVAIVKTTKRRLIEKNEK